MPVSCGTRLRGILKTMGYFQNGRMPSFSPPPPLPSSLLKNQQPATTPAILQAEKRLRSSTKLQKKMMATDSYHIVSLSWKLWGLLRIGGGKIPLNGWSHWSPVPYLTHSNRNGPVLQLNHIKLLSHDVCSRSIDSGPHGFCISKFHSSLSPVSSQQI